MREAFSKTVSPTVSALEEAGVLSLLNQAVVSLQQIPKLVNEVGSGEVSFFLFGKDERSQYHNSCVDRSFYHRQVAYGARDFVPTPHAVRAAARKAYRARRTLVLEYSDDALDESDQIEELLKEAESITRMRRPMVDIDTQRMKLEGGHATPLLAPPLDVADRAEDLLGKDAARERLQYEQASKTVDELVRWLEEGNL
jgi:hypothetical protein